MTFKDLIQARQSVRSFKPECPSRQELEQVLDAGRLAPSAVNFQPWSFIVVTEKKMLAKLHACYHREWFNTASACIVAIGHHDESWHRNADNNDFCDVDVAIAIDHLTLRATDLGLGTCWVCNFDADMVISLFELPEQHEAIALIPIGYPTKASDVEVKDKKRKKLDDVIVWID